MLFEIPLKLKRNDNRPEVSLLKYDIPKTIVCGKKKANSSIYQIAVHGIYGACIGYTKYLIKISPNKGFLVTINICVPLPHL